MSDLADAILRKLLDSANADEMTGCYIEVYEGGDRSTITLDGTFNLAADEAAYCQRIVDELRAAKPDADDHATVISQDDPLAVVVLQSNDYATFTCGGCGGPVTVHAGSTRHCCGFEFRWTLTAPHPPDTVNNTGEGERA